MKKPWCKNPFCGLATLMVGIFCILGLLLTVVYQKGFKDFIRTSIRSHLAITKDSLMFKLWTEPPVNPILAIYVYNFTNMNEFMDGNEDVPIVEELGPYLYNAKHEKVVQSWGNGSVQFRSRTIYKKVTDQDWDDNDVIIIPNLLMFTGMLKTDVQPLPEVIKKQVVWPILSSTGRKTPILHLTVKEFIWGYEDELACIKQDQKDDPEEDGGDDPFDDSDDDLFAETTTVGFEDKPDALFKQEREFRDPESGKCLFGALVEKNGTWTKITEIEDGTKDIYRKGKIESIDGHTKLGVWVPESSCNTLAGLQEPSLVPPLPDSYKTDVQSMDFLVDLMCRPIPFVPAGDLINQTDKILTQRFRPRPGTFHRSDEQEQCYFPAPAIVKVPEGTLPIHPCCEGCPLAVSFPRFLNADPWYRDQVRGVPEPNKEDHLPYVDVEPALGALVAVQMRLQVNLMLKRDEAFPPLANLPSGDRVTVLPVFWAQEGYARTPPSTLCFLEVIVQLPDHLFLAFVAVTSITGALCSAIPLFTCLRRKSWAQRISRRPEQHSSSERGDPAEPFLSHK